MDEWLAKYPSGLTLKQLAYSFFYPLYLRHLDEFWGPYVSDGKLKWREIEWKLAGRACSGF